MGGGHKLGIKQRSRPRYPGHPLTLREGQVFMPLHGRRRADRQRLIITRLDHAAGTASAKREEAESSVTIKANRVLEAADGPEGWPVGLHYRFCGWLSRPRGYPTGFVVERVDREKGRIHIRIPEWDPRVTVNEPMSQFPEEVRCWGATGWLKADLAAREQSKLQVHAPVAKDKSFGIPFRPMVHPVSVHPGQRYRRRVKARARRSVLRVVEILDEQAILNDEVSGRRIPVNSKTLLEVKKDGSGLKYEYVGGALRASERDLARLL